MEENSLIELEAKLAYQEDMLQQLNTVICRQQNQIDSLFTKFRQLSDQANELSLKNSNSDTEVEIPPHY